MQPLNDLSMRMPVSAWWTAFSHDGRYLYCCGDHADIWIWDASSFQLQQRLETEINPIFGAALHPTQEILAAGSNEGKIYLWDLQTGTQLLQIDRHKQGISLVRFADNGSLIVSASVDGTVRLTESNTGKRVGKLRRLSPIHALAVSGTGDRYGAAHYRGLSVWNNDGQELFKFYGIYYHGGEGQSDIALPGNGEIVWATFRTAPYLRAWRLTEAQPELIIAKDLGGPAFQLTFSADERLIAVGLRCEIILVDAETGEIISRWTNTQGAKNHGDMIYGLSFSPDGKLLASGDVAGGIWIWPINY